MLMKAKKEDREFQAALKKHASLDRKSGNIAFHDMYASCYINVCWKGGIISISHAHLVWFLEHGRWPEDGMVLDHINDDPMDNRPDNLQEYTQAENQMKRRGRMVYRSYGTSEYGHGIHVHHDKRDGRWYVRRQLSRGYGVGDLKNVRKQLGGFATLAEAEERIKYYVAEIEKYGKDYMPEPDQKKESKHTIRLKAETPKIRALRQQGHTMREIAEMTGFCEATIHKVTTDIGIDRRKGLNTRVVDTDGW